MELLRRIAPIQKVALGGPRNAHIQRDSLDVTSRVPPSGSIVIVDDIITSGSASMGSALRLLEAFPGLAGLHAFAAMRTLSDPAEFREIRSPVNGVVHLHADGTCRRRP